MLLQAAFRQLQIDSNSGLKLPTWGNAGLVMKAEIYYLRIEGDEDAIEGKAPLSRRSCVMSSNSINLEMCRGVPPLSVLAFALAPLLIRTSTVSMLPPSTAKCSGVCPSPSRHSTSAPNSTRIMTTSLLPLIAAMWSGVRPYWSQKFVVAPFSSRDSSCSISPRLAAWRTASPRSSILTTSVCVIVN